MNHWRLATPDDDAYIVQLFLALNREDEGQIPCDARNMLRTLAALREAPTRGRAVVLDEAGTARGYALLIAFWSNEYGGACCCVDELYVAPEARGRGHAGALLDALHAGSPLWPGEVAALVLEVTADNHRARALYARHGFVGDNVAMRRLSDR
ncbi:MAG: GNAT family N-acetyltransferase [Polyangiales bacterium]